MPRAMPASPLPLQKLRGLLFGRLLGIGLLLGVSVALTAGPSLRALLFGVGPQDVATIAATSGRSTGRARTRSSLVL